MGKRTDKNSHINFNKIKDYIKTLSEYGTRAGEPFVKHISGEIWELRSLKNRILFFAYDGEQIILLSHFIKKTQKTPQREIDKAKSLECVDKPIDTLQTSKREVIFSDIEFVGVHRYVKIQYRKKQVFIILFPKKITK